MFFAKSSQEMEFSYRDGTSQFESKFELLENTTESNVIFSICYMFCKEASMMYKVQDEKRQKLIRDKNLLAIVNESKVDESLVDLSYLTYHHFYNNLILYISEYLYDNSILDHSSDNHIAQNLIKNHPDEARAEGVFLDLCDKIQDTAINYRIRSDAVDILLRSSVKRYVERGHQLLDVLRREVYDRPLLNQRDDMLYYRNNDVYNDAQNVHNKDINSISIEKAEQLISETDFKLFQDEREFCIKAEEVLVKKFPTNRKTIKEVIRRIRIETATFGKKDINLRHVFIAIYSFIETHKQKEDLFVRLIQEFVDMEGFCATGYFMRLMNSIRSFSNGKYDINLSDETQTYSKVKRTLDMAISNAENSSYLLELFVEYDKKILLEFARDTINNVISELRVDHSIDHIIASLHKYFSVQNKFGEDEGRITLLN